MKSPHSLVGDSHSRRMHPQRYGNDYPMTAPNPAGRHAPPLPGANTVVRSAVAARNQRGNLVGERHPRARLSDHDIDLIRALHEGEDGLGYRAIARKFEISVRTVRAICNYQRRAATPMRHTTQPPDKPGPIAPAEAARRFGYRQEDLLNELADACGLHRNTFAALVRNCDLLQRKNPKEDRMRQPEERGQDSAKSARKPRRNGKSAARAAQRRLKPRPPRPRKPASKPRR